MDTKTTLQKFHRACQAILQVLYNHHHPPHSTIIINHHTLQSSTPTTLYNH
jgi:hypothetical protein